MKSEIYRLRDFFLPFGDEDYQYKKFRVAAFIRLFFVLPALFGLTLISMLRAMGHTTDTVNYKRILAIWIALAVLYVIANIATLLTDKRRAVFFLSALSLVLELLTNEIVIYLTGTVVSHALVFMVVAIAVYRVFFDYRLGLLAALGSIIIHFSDVILLRLGILPNRPSVSGFGQESFSSDAAFSYTSAIFISIIITFFVINLGMNQVGRLRAIITQKANTDVLTGLNNKRSFMEQWEAVFRKLPNSGRTLSLLMWDIDNFKSYNDTFGHVEGDALLKLVAETIRGSVRPSDLVARFGGEEFVVLLPDTDKKNAMTIGERIREMVESKRGEGVLRPVTISGGAATYGADTRKAEELLEIADKRLYEAKRSGRNRLVG